MPDSLLATEDSKRNTHLHPQDSQVEVRQHSDAHATGGLVAETGEH